MKTDFDTLKDLANYLINLLKDKKIIEFGLEHRSDLVEAFATELNVGLSTDEDIKEQAIEEIEEKMGEINLPEDITESEMYNHARKEIIKSFNGENISGLYLVDSLHQLAVRAKDFLLDSEHIEDVYGSDDDIVKFLVSKIRGYSPRRG